MTLRGKSRNTWQGASLAQVQKTLLAWYARHGRDLPWRHTSDPYSILVAEIMLQQTQVERVLPKYREFLEAFPAVEDLARAPRGAVIRLWAPLGYNLRAVRLHQIAQQVVNTYGGRFPQTVDQLLHLKGIGPYTAGAIACFAYRQPVAFIDTNIRRVLGRCFGGIPFPTSAQDRPILALAEQALPEEAYYAWHQGLMDLGATVCTWARPDCPQCPLEPWCIARPHILTEREVGRGVAERRARYRIQPRYAGSRRFYRGKIVSALRELQRGGALSLEALGLTVKPDFTAADLPWLADLVAGLASDGLVALYEGHQPVGTNGGTALVLV